MVLIFPTVNGTNFTNLYWNCGSYCVNNNTAIYKSNYYTIHFLTEFKYY